MLSPTPATPGRKENPILIDDSPAPPPPPNDSPAPPPPPNLPLLLQPHTPEPDLESVILATESPGGPENPILIDISPPSSPTIQPAVSKSPKSPTRRSTSIEHSSHLPALLLQQPYPTQDHDHQHGRNIRGSSGSPGPRSGPGASAGPSITQETLFVSIITGSVRSHPIAITLPPSMPPINSMGIDGIFLSVIRENTTNADQSTSFIEEISPDTDSNAHRQNQA